MNFNNISLDLAEIQKLYPENPLEFFRNKNLFFLILIIIILGLFFYFNQSSDFLTYKSCEELETLMAKEAEKIDFSCVTSKDCVYTDVLICGGCINKDADTAEYEKIQKVIKDMGLSNKLYVQKKKGKITITFDRKLNSNEIKSVTDVLENEYDINIEEVEKFPVEVIERVI